MSYSLACLRTWHSRCDGQAQDPAGDTIACGCTCHTDGPAVHLLLLTHTACGLDAAGLETSASDHLITCKGCKELIQAW